MGDNEPDNDPGDVDDNNNSDNDATTEKKNSNANGSNNTLSLANGSNQVAANLVNFIQLKNKEALLSKAHALANSTGSDEYSGYDEEDDDKANINATGHNKATYKELDEDDDVFLNSYNQQQQNQLSSSSPQSISSSQSTSSGDVLNGRAGSGSSNRKMSNKIVSIEASNIEQEIKKSEALIYLNFSK